MKGVGELFKHCCYYLITVTAKESLNRDHVIHRTQHFHKHTSNQLMRDTKDKKKNDKIET